MNDRSAVRLRHSEQRMSDARSSDLPSRSRFSTVFRRQDAGSIDPPPSMKRDNGLRISGAGPSPSVQRSDERHGNVQVEEKRRLTVDKSGNSKVYHVPHIPSCHQAQTNRYIKNCPACRKLKQFEQLQRLRLKPPCKQNSDQKKGIAKRSSRHRKKSREKTSRHKESNGNAVRPCKSRQKTNRNILRIKDSEPEVDNGRNTESGSNVSSSAYISSQEKLPSSNNSIPGNVPMDT